MALTTKYFATTVTASATVAYSLGANLYSSRSAGATSTLYVVPSGRNAKVKLIYASLSVTPPGTILYTGAGASASGSTNGSAFLNIGGAANFSTGPTYTAFSQYNNVGGSIGWQGANGSAFTANFAANANAPISISNYFGYYLSTGVMGFAQGLNVPPQGFMLINSSTSYFSLFGPAGGLSYKFFSFMPQNFFLTSGQSIDVTAAANIVASVSSGYIYNSTMSTVASVSVLVIEEAAN